MGKLLVMGALAVAAENLVETRVRLLHPGECIPLDVGFKQLDHNWAWVNVVNGEIVSAVLACPCHGMVQIVRLVSDGKHSLVSLLREVIRECSRRGFKGYIVWLDPERNEEQQLMRIFERAEAVVTESRLHAVAGSLEKLERF